MKRPLFLSLIAAGLMATTPLIAQESSGAYLAARLAAMNSDYDKAVVYFDRAIAAGVTQLRTLEEAVISNVAAGRIKNAARIGAMFNEAGGSNQIVTLVRSLAAMEEGDFAPASVKPTATEGLAPLLDGLLQAWALLGEGNMSAATTAFAEVAKTPDFASLAWYHEALALASVGDFESADAIFSGEKYGALSVSARGIEAHAQILAQLDRTDDAIELLNAAQAGGFSPDLNALQARIASGAPQTYDFVTTAQEGAAELLFTVAAIINGRAAPEHVLIYTRLASFLRPDHAPAALTSGQILEDMGQSTLAAAAYDQVPADHPSFFMAEMGRADALFAADREDAAIEVMTALSKREADLPVVHAALGDYLGRARQDDAAIAAYTKAIELRGEDEFANWRVFYARGIVHERNKRFEEMETDFRKALELNPNQPDVLNYLGYALVEQRIKLDEALEMIQTAVAERPDSGYITDSLGWIFYRLGRFEDAVAPMETAVSLLPVDPIVNDHLGDVYWKVGRTREAEFQWKRALSFEPTEEEAERIRRKLEVGLDVVLEEEKAETGEAETADN